MIQNIIVVIIILFSSAFVIHKLYKFIKRFQNNSPCDSTKCSSCPYSENSKCYDPIKNKIEINKK